jgi:hypothetical protein
MKRHKLLWKKSEESKILTADLTNMNAYVNAWYLMTRKRIMDEMRFANASVPLAPPTVSAASTVDDPGDNTAGDLGATGDE